jgi:hypothetical protein
VLTLLSDSGPALYLPAGRPLPAQRQFLLSAGPQPACQPTFGRGIHRVGSCNVGLRLASFQPSQRLLPLMRRS